MSASVQQTDFYHIHNVLPEMTSRINDGLCVCVCVCVYREALDNCRNISLALALLLGNTCGIWGLKINLCDRGTAEASGQELEC